MTFQMSSNAARGWWWGTSSHTNAQGSMSLNTEGKLTVLHSVNVGTAYSIYPGSVNASGWFRSEGNSGWYSTTHGGGIHMSDTSWVRVYNGKAFYVSNQIAATGNVTAYYSDMRLKSKVANIENALDKYVP